MDAAQIKNDKFRVAEKLTEAACLLDTAKLAWPDVDQLWYLTFVEKMYDVAETLAGDRKAELYRNGDAAEEETHL